VVVLRARIPARQGTRVGELPRSLARYFIDHLPDGAAPSRSSG
jgi:hypothetical protein